MRFFSYILLVTIGVLIPIECTAPSQISASYIFQAPTKTLRIAAVGDILLGLNYPDSLIRTTPDDGASLLNLHSSIIRKANLSLGNLEGVLLDKGNATKSIQNATVKYLFRMPERYAFRLKKAGFDFMSLANNHTRDFGIDGLRSTMRSLSNENIHYAGIKGICESVIIKKDNIRYGVCAFAPYAATVSILDYGYSTKIISELKKKCDIVIVSMHTGAEGIDQVHVPHSMEIFHGELRGDAHRFAHLAIDSGADLVLGHGPHVVRAMELYKDRLIAYSLGNYCTPFGVSKVGKCGYAPLLEIFINNSGEFLYGKIHSAIQKGSNGPVEDSDNLVIDEIRKLSQEDYPNSELKIDKGGRIYRGA